MAAAAQQEQSARLGHSALLADIMGCASDLEQMQERQVRGGGGTEGGERGAPGAEGRIDEGGGGAGGGVAPEGERGSEWDR